jgi:protein-tyrosine phosphatase
LKAHFALELTGIRKKAQIGYACVHFRAQLLHSARFKGMRKAVTKTVLFICTGNFYRSRFAEAVFNYHASQLPLPWKAISRGLAIHWATGPLSPFTAGALFSRRIPLHHTAPNRMQLTENDLKAADLRILMDRTEHFAMMVEQFPLWTDRVEYWEVPDLPINQPEVALPAIEGKVLALLDRLSR